MPMYPDNIYMYPLYDTTNATIYVDLSLENNYCYEIIHT